MKYIFLDFDGVLHGTEDKWNVPKFHLSVHLEKVIRLYQENVRIVISSSWREEYPFDVLVSFLSEDLQYLIIGSTPILDDGYKDEGRYKEIKLFCEQNNISINDWVAIDDMQRLFPKPCNNLILVNGKVGLSKKELNKIKNFIQPQLDYKNYNKINSNKIPI